MRKIISLSLLLALALTVGCERSTEKSATAATPSATPIEQGSSVQSVTSKPISLDEDAFKCADGNWVGTIGKASVSMTFDDLIFGEGGVGRYYYGKSLEDMLLVSDGHLVSDGQDVFVWKEIDPRGNVTGYLNLSCKGTSIEGQWQSADESKVLLIHLESDPSREYETSRNNGIHFIVKSKKSIGSHKYEVLGLANEKTISAVRLVGKTPGIKKINDALLATFLGALNDYINCDTSTRMDGGRGKDVTMNVLELNDAYLVTEVSEEIACGLSDMNIGYVHTTFSLDTGAVEKMSDWLIEKYRGDISLDSSLGKLLSKIYSKQEKGDAAESDPVEVNCEFDLGGAAIWPTSDGLAFETQTSATTLWCSRTLIVPYEKMNPYLSEQGKAAIQYFRKH